MQIIPTAIPDVRILVPRRFADARGFFCEIYNRRTWAELGLDMEFVQDNHSLSVKRGVVRGLHFQIPPMGQHKLVRVLRGAIFDVAVDLRRSSPTFGKHVAATLSAENGHQLLIPIGFAHGFCTLLDNTEVFYKVGAPYSPQHERGLLWNDPDLGIDWPVTDQQAILSEKDRAYPRLRELRDVF